METETIIETINHEYYVSLEVAKLLKEAGFNQEVNHSYPDRESLDNSCSGYMEDLSFYHNLNDGKYGGMSAPTLEIAQRWFREVKNIDVYIFPTTNTKRECVYQVGIKTFGRTLWLPWQPSTTEYATYEEAQEAGIKKALEIILEKGGQHDS